MDLTQRQFKSSSGKHKHPNASLRTTLESIVWRDDPQIFARMRDVYKNFNRQSWRNCMSYYQNTKKNGDRLRCSLYDC